MSEESFTYWLLGGLFFQTAWHLHATRMLRKNAMEMLEHMSKELRQAVEARARCEEALARKGDM